MKKSIRKTDLLYPELSYQIIGILFEVCNELGPGHREKYYETAVEESLKQAGLKYQRQLYTPLTFKGKTVGKYYLDFLIDEKIVLELKQGNQFSKQHIEQVYRYLKMHNLQLGILAQFTSQNLKYKRIINIR